MRISRLFFFISVFALGLISPLHAATALEAGADRTVLVDQ